MAGGGAASNVVDLIVCSQPSDPDRAASRAARNPASNRRWNPICTAVALPLVDLITSSVPSTSGATGFSQNTGTPACTPRLISSGCVPVGAAMTSPSTPASSSSVTDPAVRAPNSRGHLPRPLQVRVRDDQRVDSRQSAQRAGVEHADPPYPDESDTHEVPLRCPVIW